MENLFILALTLLFGGYFLIRLLICAYKLYKATKEKD